ncbi:hypothetical protein LBLM1_04980 [Limosilactobacillus mucosae LM1]|uniref:Uncharacterized protein n=1 Tax=Limosilactobacillus mucosae LM1 TaxID=1130798 RepID=A0A0D4CJX5_LIMMU|nr:hypothetical protein LBLM1_04980 [Limosilactobacillus mucosae LM1]
MQYEFTLTKRIIQIDQQLLLNRMPIITGRNDLIYQTGIFHWQSQLVMLVIGVNGLICDI